MKKKVRLKKIIIMIIKKRIENIFWRNFLYIIYYIYLIIINKKMVLFHHPLEIYNNIIYYLNKFIN